MSVSRQLNRAGPVRATASIVPQPGRGVVNGALQFDYTTVGHVTVDVLADGSRRTGGSAFYSALQAARLGLRTLIITRGAAGEIEELIAPYLASSSWRSWPAERTTTLETAGEGHARSQRVLAWAGPMPEDLVLDTAILHLAPVARETPQRWRGRAGFVGLTPQGLVRRFSQSDPVFSLAALHGAAARSLAARCDALVLASVERESCAELISAARLRRRGGGGDRGRGGEHAAAARRQRAGGGRGGAGRPAR